MIFITAYERINNGVNEVIEFLFDPMQEQLFQRVNGEKRLMGQPESFVYPHVPQPQNMKSQHAKKVTIFCKEWLFNKEIIRELNHDHSYTA